MNESNSLLAIAPTFEAVTVQGVTVNVYGLSAKGIAQLLARFPEIREIVTGGDVSFDKLLELGGDIVAAIIAAGIGKPGDAQEEAAASLIALEGQADLITVILKKTMPSGLGPFVERLNAIGLVMTDTSDTSPNEKLPEAAEPNGEGVETTLSAT